MWHISYNWLTNIDTLLKSVVYIGGSLFVLYIYMNFNNCVMLFIHHYSIIENIFTALKFLCAPPIYPSIPPPTLTTTDLISIVLPFPERWVFGIIQHITFRNWFIVLSNTHLKFFHIFLCLGSSFLSIVE